jgi:hypothetical protein
VANLLKKETSGRLLDHAGAFVERKRAEQLEEDFLIRTAGAAVAAAALKRGEEGSPVHTRTMERVDSRIGSLELNHAPASHTPLKRSKEVEQINTSTDLAPAMLMKATVTPGGRSPPLLPKIEELREDLTSSADEDSGSDGDLARDLGTSPDGRRKKIRSKLRNSRRLSLSEPNLATSPQSQHHTLHTLHTHRGRSNSKNTRQPETKRLDDEEEWERTSDGEVKQRQGGRDTNGGVERSDETSSDGSDYDREDNNSARGHVSDGSDEGNRSSLDYGRRSEDGEGSGSGGSRRRAKFFKYSADILAKTKAAGGRDRDRDDRKRMEEQRRREKDRTKEEEREKRKKERMDEKEARRRGKEGKDRRKMTASDGIQEREREKEREREGLHLMAGDSADKKRRHKEEKEMKRRKEEEEKESKRKRKEEYKEMKKLHKLEKRASAASNIGKEGASEAEGGEAGDAGKDKHKKAFGLLPLPHLHHGHSLSFHLPSSPRRNPNSSSNLLKTPPSPRAHIAPITFNRTTPHPQAQEVSPRKPPPTPSRESSISSDDSSAS